ncbi:hypothetical protein [Kribbella sp. NPDC000426]
MIIDPVRHVVLLEELDAGGALVEAVRRRLGCCRGGVGTGVR